MHYVDLRSKNMTEHLLLVDLSHLMYRALSVPALAKLHTKSKLPTGGIYGVLQSISKCLEADPTISRVYLLRDGYTKWRKDFFPEYKANREANPASPYYKSYIEPNSFGWSKKDTLTFTNNQLDNLAKKLGLHIIFEEYSEADDLAYLLAKEYVNQDTKVTFLTSDRDWLQLLKFFPETTVYDEMKNIFITNTNFESYFGYNIKWFHFMKAMLGDKSDNIPSVVSGLGEKGLLFLINQCEQHGIDPENPAFFTQLVDLVATIPESQCGRYKIIKQIDISKMEYYNRNIKLIDFRQSEYSGGVLTETLHTIHQEDVKLNYLDAVKSFKELELSSLGKILIPGSPFYGLH